MRPARLGLVVGTGTGVGKTWVTCALVAALRGQQRVVAARKPAQSFSPGESTDAELLARATGESPYQVCPEHRWYERPMAPPMAAAALGRPAFTIADLAAELSWPQSADFGLIEGAGGVRSPLAVDGDSVDLATAVVPDVVLLIADAGLGTLNLVRLCLDVLDHWRVIVFLNRFDPGNDVHRANLEWLHLRHPAPPVTAITELLGALG